METKRTEIISVDPGRKTLGALYSTVNPSILETAARTVCPERKSVKSEVNAMLPTSVPGVNRFGAYMLAFRIFLASVLSASGILILSGHLSAPTSPLPAFHYALFEIIAGVSLGLGLFTRFSMGAITLLFTASAVESLVAGVFDMQAFLSFFACLWFFTAGSGKFSCDFLIKKGLRKRAIRRRRRLEEDRLSYKAMFCD